jgi:hypothetical protein
MRARCRRWRSSWKSSCAGGRGRSCTFGRAAHGSGPRLEGLFLRRTGFGETYLFLTNTACVPIPSRGRKSPRSTRRMRLPDGAKWRARVPRAADDDDVVVAGQIVRQSKAEYCRHPVAHGRGGWTIENDLVVRLANDLRSSEGFVPTLTGSAVT